MNSSLSFTHLILEAHIFVKIVMLVLLLAGIYSLYTYFKKSQQLKRFENSHNYFQQEFLQSNNLEELYQQNAHTQKRVEGSLRIFMMGLFEFKNFRSQSSPELINQSCKRAMENALLEEERNVYQDLDKLATIASAAPYIGLLGTVFGIMNSFMAISSAGNSSVASVAPGIAEALIATAIGLFSAISALLAHNFLSSRAERLLQQYEYFIDTFSAVLLHRSLSLRERQR